MVNSPVYGFPGRISSVNQAVLLLGLNVVKGLLFGVTVFDLMQQTMIGLWEHSLGCAIISRLVAKKKGMKDPEEASIHGLLHDIGKVILVLQFREEYEEVMNEAETRGITVYEAENEYFSTSHATVGAWVAEQWSFPMALTDVIAYHHKPQLSKVAPMQTAIVHFSDVLLTGEGIRICGGPRRSTGAPLCLGFACIDGIGHQRDSQGGRRPARRSGGPYAYGLMRAVAL